MNIRVLGTGTCVPSLHRCSSSYLVQTKRLHILIDVGPSIVRRLLEYGFTTRDIDAIVLTHFHVDHTADLSTFLFASNYDVEARTKPLTIIGGPGINDFFENLIKVYRWLTPKSYELFLREEGDCTLNLEDFVISVTRVEHNDESIAIRIEEHKSVTFSGDTDYTKNLVKLASGTDLLIAECSFPERKVDGHLNLETLQRIVDEANPKRVLISHLYPEWDDFSGVLHAPYLLGEDGMEIEV
jgi:ribonuclease BN (tRNA processing enzyme)